MFDALRLWIKGKLSTETTLLDKLVAVFGIAGMIPAVLIKQAVKKLV